MCFEYQNEVQEVEMLIHLSIWGFRKKGIMGGIRKMSLYPIEFSKTLCDLAGKEILYIFN